MSTISYAREGNDILFHDGICVPEKVANIDKNGTLRMAKGQTDHRDAVEAFLEEDKEPIEDDHDPKWEESRDEASDPQPEGVAMFSEDPDANPKEWGTIPPCPDEDPNEGDKTAAVVEWYRAYHPEEFAKRYGHRRGTNITG